MNRKVRSTRRDQHGRGRARRSRPDGSALVVAISALYALARYASWTGPREPEAKATGKPAAPAAARERPADPAPASPAPDSVDARRSDARATRRGHGRRLGGALVFATLFFTGAALSAIAGDTVSSLIASGQVPETVCGEPAAAPVEEDSTAADPVEDCVPEQTETDEEPVSEPAPEEAAPDPAGPQEDGSPVPGESDPSSGPGDSAPPHGSPPAPAPASGGNAGGPAGSGRDPREGAPLVDTPRPDVPTALDPEAENPHAVVWLHRSLPDPTPPAKRLAPSFARALRMAAADNRIPWSFLLGVVRAQGHSGRIPVGPAALGRIAAQLAEERDALGAYRPWLIALRYSGRTAFADRALALARYNRSVGLRGLVTGLAAAKPAIAARVLADPEIELYPGGRADVAAGRTDVRVLVLLRYLRLAHGSVTVSSLTAGHRTFSRPGVVSAHVYGLAVDISSLGGTPIAGNQGPHGITERAVRSILLLPAELAPQQVISLLGLGGPSFPLADHDDHIHVGY